MDKQTIEVGIITKPHGIKGDIKVKDLTFGNFIFKAGEEVLVDATWLKITKVSKLGADYVLGLEGLNLELANKLKNKSIFARREKVKNNGGYFVADLINKPLYSDDGTQLGLIDDIQNFGTADVVYVKGKKPFLFSNIGGIIISADENKVVVNIEKLKEVICYED